MLRLLRGAGAPPVAAGADPSPRRSLLPAPSLPGSNRDGGAGRASGAPGLGAAPAPLLLPHLRRRDEDPAGGPGCSTSLELVLEADAPLGGSRGASLGVSSPALAAPAPGGEPDGSSAGHL